MRKMWMSISLGLLLALGLTGCTGSDRSMNTAPDRTPDSRMEEGTIRGDLGRAGENVMEGVDDVGRAVRRGVDDLGDAMTDMDR